MMVSTEGKRRDMLVRCKDDKTNKVALNPIVFTSKFADVCGLSGLVEGTDNCGADPRGRGC